MRCAVVVHGMWGSRGMVVVATVVVWLLGCVASCVFLCMHQQHAWLIYLVYVR